MGNKTAIIQTKDKKRAEHVAKVHNECYEKGIELKAENWAGIRGKKLFTTHRSVYNGCIRRGRVDVYFNKKGYYVVR